MSLTIVFTIKIPVYIKHSHIYKQAVQFGTKENEINDVVLSINTMYVCAYTYIRRIMKKENKLISTLMDSGNITTVKVTITKFWLV